MLLYTIIALLAIVLGITLFNVITAPMLKHAPAVRGRPRVSVLIPARNEAANIEACLQGLLVQDYPDLEILVLDDNSSDETAAIVNRLTQQDRRVKLITGQSLPTGWLGKNWACHQLRTYATGELLIFSDADSRYAPTVVSGTVGWMQQLELSLLSAFAHPITVTLAEKLVVPVFHMLVYGYLPLWLTYFSRAASVSAASGSWIAINRRAYDRIGGHRAIRNQIVDDVELSRLAKRLGEKMLTVSGKDMVYCRMYGSAPEIWQGFSKNMFGLMQFKAMPFFMALAVLAMIHVLPYVLVWLEPFTSWAILAIAMNLTFRFALALKFAQPLLVSTVLHPLAITTTLLIGLNSYRWYKKGNIKWKGRQLAVRPS
ncbi:MAG: glycosyltransferase family 2 protein [candidate division KSB1 bacterium]|nr:glycosyltransferase family 2 protein [candidate division KSB1 bacterium]